MKIYNQCDPAYGSTLLGGGTHPGTMCQYGCLENDDASIANDSGHSITPPQLNSLLLSKGVYVAESDGTLDLLPDNALDLAFPGDYQTTHYSGFRADLIAAAVPSPDVYTVLHVVGYSPGWGMNVNHFVIAWTPDGAYVGDPQGGTVRALSFYGGSANVEKTTLTKRLPAVPLPPPTPQPTPTPVPKPLPPNPNPSLHYPASTWVSSPSFTADRRDAADPPTEASYDLSKGYDIVFHSTDGTIEATDAVFKNPNPGGSGGPRSAHFAVLKDGQVHQYVDLKDCAWHAGNFTENRQSIGIEHVDDGNNQAPRTQAQLDASAALVAWIEHSLGPARSYIPHSKVVPTSCPGNLPIDQIVAAAQKLEHPVPPSPQPLPTPIPTPAPTLAGILQDFIVQLILLLRYWGRTQASASAKARA